MASAAIGYFAAIDERKVCLASVWRRKHETGENYDS